MADQELSAILRMLPSLPSHAVLTAQSQANKKTYFKFVFVPSVKRAVPHDVRLFAGHVAVA